MQAETYLLAANILVWLGIGCYIALLARNQRRLEQRLRQMEMLRND